MSKKKITSAKQLSRINFVGKCYWCHFEIKDFSHYIIPQVMKKWPDLDDKLYTLKKQYSFHVSCFIQLMAEVDY
jgi:hypothetical protein